MIKFLNKINKLNLIQKILIGMTLGAILGLLFPNLSSISLLGSLFVGALKSIAPLLVFFLVISAISQNRASNKSNMSYIVIIYLIATFLASLTGVIASFLFPSTLKLASNVNNIIPPQGINEVINTILLNIVANPIGALISANYIGILSWAIIFGISLKNSHENVKNLLQTLAESTSLVLKWIISFAPVGILGLVFQTVSTNGLEIFIDYLHLLLVLIGSMLFIALFINPLIVFFIIKENPYPLVFKCLKESGVTAFFTRSSAANIPINMKICEEMNLDEEIYSVSIPLGATINMAGAAITISVLTLAAVNTLGIQIDFFSALILSVLAALSACGASGVTGGSLLLIPVACSLFGISNDIAMQVVGVGFIIGVIQDSCETALNSSSDLLFTIASNIKMRK